MNKSVPLKQENDFKDLPPETLRILGILDKIEEHTARLRSELMQELKSQGSEKNVGSIHIKLDSV